MKFKAEWCKTMRMWHLICPLGGCIYNCNHVMDPHTAASIHAKNTHNGMLLK